MIAIIAMIFSQFASAQTCNIESLEVAPKVKVYYQTVVQAGDEYAKPLVTEVVTLSGTVDPRKVELDGLKVSRPKETVQLSTQVLLQDGVIPDSMKFVLDESSINGRIEGDPKITFDEAKNLATIHLTMKYKDGKFDKQTVSADGVVTYAVHDVATQAVVQPEVYSYQATLNATSGKIEPIASDSQKIKVGELNEPDRIIIRDSGTGCVWFEGDVASSSAVMRAILPEDSKSQVQLQGKPLEILPYVSDNQLVIEVKEE